MSFFILMNRIQRIEERVLMMPSLHILDQVAIPKGQSAQETLVHTTELAKLAETLGYERYWFAEHHSTRGLASTAPEILMAHIASHTSTLRTGSGGFYSRSTALLK